jgi:hypothetical protein
MRTRRSWKNQDRLFKELGREGVSYPVDMSGAKTDMVSWSTATPVCEWKENSDGVWETGCTNMFEVTAGTPASNNMKFCCYCGEKLKEEAYHCDVELTAQKEAQDEPR